VWQDRKGRPYEPAIGPRLRVLLYFIFLTFGLLGATAVYLVSVRGLEEVQGRSYFSFFSICMFAAHEWLGVLFVLPFLIFGIVHLSSARKRKNRLAVRLGLLLFVTGTLVCLTGLALMQLPGLPQLPSGTLRAAVLWAHGVLPVLAILIYVQHRRAGPAIKWRLGFAWAGAVAAFVGVMLYMHSADPRKWYAKGSPEGEKYFEPSRARTVDANFIPAHALMNDKYCLKCHADIFKSHMHSAHRFSSFNNPAYLFSVRETRRRMGTRASRWCAGCHDPVPFFSGQFDDPNFDDVNNPTAHAGITCTVCHSITNVNSRSGNGDYTIEEPIHYPFAYSDDPVLQWLNEQMVKAKPEFHKRTFLKPFHKTEAFCSVCHKVGVPQEVNHYKEFLRGQNHDDSWWLSGVSGHGTRSWYYPPMSKTNCAQCHMPLLESEDFGARDFDGSGKRKIHSHLFPSANTGVPALLKYPGYEKVIKAHTNVLTKGFDGKSPPLRIDLFGLKELTDQLPGVGAALIDDKPLRPNLPKLRPGSTYLVDAVIRTLNMGHHFTQGTVDSNEVWVDFQVWAVGKKGKRRLLARNGGMDGGEDEGRVDEHAHFLNVWMLDRHGNRIDRRNPQDIFTPLYDHQIPPGAAAVVHYRVEVPRDLKQGEAIELSARVRYRKFDHRYMEIIHGAGKVPKLPIVDLCSDKVVLPVAGVAEEVPAQTSPIKPAWQRWNDYGIGCFLEGGPDGKKDGELAQAERSFRRLLSAELKDAKDAHAHGHLNLARVHLAYGDLKQTATALAAARKCNPPAPWWTVAWFTAQVNLQNGNLAEAITTLETLLDPKNRDPKRKLDFSRDWVAINELGKAHFELGKEFFWGDPESADPDAEKHLRQAVARFEETLKFDPDNVEAHDFLGKCYARLGGMGGKAPGLPADLRPEEKRLTLLLDLAGALGRAGEPPSRRIEAINDLITFLDRQGREASASRQPRLAVLLEVRRRIRAASAASTDVWLRLAAGRAINALDRRVLAALAALGERLVTAREDRSARLKAVDELAEAFAQLSERPPPADVRPTFFAAVGFPSSGLPVNLVLAGLADRDQLQGPLPQPRLLTLWALRQQARPLFTEPKDGELQAAAARVLARVHLLMHGIFKPDENAAGRAVNIARQRNPVAARASQPVVIYPVHPARP
jgi:tetratricopeptide (TPR) repeat protein